MSKPELTTLDYERMFYATTRKNQNANRNRTRRFHLGMGGRVNLMRGLNYTCPVDKGCKQVIDIMSDGRFQLVSLGSVVNITEKEARDMLAKSNYVAPKGK